MTTSTAAMTDHPFAFLAAPPYRLVGIETTEDRQATNAAAAASGLPFTTNMCGGACDACGTAIWNVYRFEGSDGRRFKVGCDCADKALGREVVREHVRSYRDALAAEKSIERTRARLEAERDENERLGHGRLTNEELVNQIEAARKAAQQARRDASRYFGKVGERMKNVELRYEGRYAYESAYGIQALYFLRRVDNDAAVVWKTSGALGREVTKGEGVDAMTVWEPIEKGHSFIASFTVKEHSQYKGEFQTKVTRLAVGETKAKGRAKRARTAA